MALLLLATWAAAARPALAQGAVLDGGVFVISRDGAVVGREEFTVRRGRSSGPDGYTITSTATYPPTAPAVTLTPVVELGPDSLPVQVQFDVFGNGQSRVYARFGPRRVTLRIVRPSGESAQELPATGRELVVDDSVFGLYAVRPALGVSRAIAPRSSTQLPADLQDLGSEQTSVQGVARQLRHYVLRLGGNELHLWYDDAWRLMRVESPAVRLIAERSPGDR